MSNKIVNTRIKNKVDLLSNWQSNDAKVLLDGEIALVRVPTGNTYINPVTNEAEPVVELLMKVGDGQSSFAALPWMSAKASDVYDWAKIQLPRDITVEVITVVDPGDDRSKDTKVTKTLNNWLKDLDQSTADNASDIASLKTAVAGGVHFIGITSSDVANAKNASNKITLVGKDSEYEALVGDIVIDSNGKQEYIWTGSKWEPLGDVSRIGAIETKINGLDVTDINAVASTHKFVSQVTQTDGKIDVTYTQPTSADISHDNSTVKNALETLDSEVTSIQSDYLRFGKSGDTNDKHIYVGDTGTDTIIFDCGGAFSE